MKICHCLFLKKDNKVTAFYKGNSGIEVLKFKGERSVPYTDKYWEDWKNHSGYCTGDIADFCLLYDTEMELPEEYESVRCDVSESIWTVEKIKGLSGLLGISENIDVCDENSQCILSIVNSGGKVNKIILFSRNINKSDFVVEQKKTNKLTPFIQYYVDKAKGE